MTLLCVIVFKKTKLFEAQWQIYIFYMQWQIYMLYMQVFEQYLYCRLTTSIYFTWHVLS